MCKLLVCLLGFSLDFTSGSFSFCFYNRGRAAICIANKALASDDLRKTKPNQTQPNPTKPNPPPKKTNKQTKKTIGSQIDNVPSWVRSRKLSSETSQSMHRPHGLWWVSLGFNVFDWGFYRVFTGFLLGFTRFYWVNLGFIGFYRVLLGYTGFYWVLPGFTGFYWVILGFVGF